MGIFSNLETINIPPLFPWEEEESSEDSFRWLISFLDAKGTISGWTSINSLQLRFQNSNKINNDTSCYILWKKKFGIWSNFVRKIGQFFRLIKRFPPVPSSRNIGGGFSRPLVGVAAIVAVKNALVLVIVHERSLPVRLASSGRGPQAQIAETGRDTFAGLRRTPRASSPSGRLDSRLCRGGGGGGQSNGVQAKGHVYSLPLCIYIYRRGEYVDSNCRFGQEGKGVLRCTPHSSPLQDLCTQRRGIRA